MSDLIPPVVRIFAVPGEFDGEGKEIIIQGFQILTLEEIVRIEGKQPKYPPLDGFVRRLLFTQPDFDKERKMDINSPRFQSDLSRFGIKPGDKGILKRVKAEKGYNWTFTKTNDKPNPENK